MSHEESIYDLIPRPRAQQQRTVMYRSKYNPTIPPTASTFGAATVTQVAVSNIAGFSDANPRTHKFRLEGSTMGPKELHTSDTGRFLTAHTTEPLAKPTGFARTQRSQAKPAVVKVHELPPKIRRPQRDFVRENAVSNIMMKPSKKAAEKPNYMVKSDYGKVPEYLGQVKGEIERERDYMRTMLQKEKQQHRANRPQMILLPEEDRFALLDDLKLKWADVNRRYQQMTHILTLDSHGKIRRKEQLELELTQLEKSIEKMSKPNVYVQEGY